MTEIYIGGEGVNVFQFEQEKGVQMLVFKRVIVTNWSMFLSGVNVSIWWLSYLKFTMWIWYFANNIFMIHLCLLRFFCT